MFNQLYSTYLVISTYLLTYVNFDSVNYITTDTSHQDSGQSSLKLVPKKMPRLMAPPEDFANVEFFNKCPGFKVQN